MMVCDGLEWWFMTVNDGGAWWSDDGGVWWSDDGLDADLRFMMVYDG